MNPERRPCNATGSSLSNAISTSPQRRATPNVAATPDTAAQPKNATAGVARTIPSSAHQQRDGAADDRVRAGDARARRNGPGVVRRGRAGRRCPRRCGRPATSAARSAATAARRAGPRRNAAARGARPATRARPPRERRPGRSPRTSPSRVTSASTAATAAYPTTTDPIAAATSTRIRSARENSGGRTVFDLAGHIALQHGHFSTVSGRAGPFGAGTPRHTTGVAPETPAPPLRTSLA